MHIHPSLGLYFRAHDTLQIGIDPLLRVTFSRLEPNERRFLCAFARARHRLDLPFLASRYGVSLSRAKELFSSLQTSGVLVEDPPSSGIPQVLGGVPLSSFSPDLSGVVMALARADPLSFHCALFLLRQGVRHWIIHDEKIIDENDHPLLLPWKGYSRSLGARYALRKVDPHVSFRRSDPTFALCTSMFALHPFVSRSFENIPRLLAECGERVCRIGPLCSPSSSLCERCIFEWEKQKDPRWFEVLAQINPSRCVCPSVVVLNMAASIVGCTLASFVHSGASALEKGHVEIYPDGKFPLFSPLFPHPDCGCQQDFPATSSSCEL